MPTFVIYLITFGICQVIGLLGLCWSLYRLFLWSKGRGRDYSNLRETKGRVVGYRLYYHASPRVEFQVEGQTYHADLLYKRIRIVQAYGYQSKLGLEDIQDPFSDSLTLYQTKQVNTSRQRQELFPIGQEMTVYYKADKPSHAFVERYPGSWKGDRRLFLAALYLLPLWGICLLLSFWSLGQLFVGATPY